MRTVAKPRGITQYNAADFRIVPPHPANEYPANYSYQGPRRWKRICELIFTRAETPYQTESDVMRAATDIGLEALAKCIDSTIITGMQHEMKMMNSIAIDATEQNNFVDYLDVLQREVEKACDRDMRESAVGWVWAYRERAKKLPDRIVGRRIVKEVNRRFAYLLKGNQGRGKDDGAGTGAGAGALAGVLSGASVEGHVDVEHAEGIEIDMDMDSDSEPIQ